MMNDELTLLLVSEDTDTQLLLDNKPDVRLMVVLYVAVSLTHWLEVCWSFYWLVFGVSPVTCSTNTFLSFLFPASSNTSRV